MSAGELCTSYCSDPDIKRVAVLTMVFFLVYLCVCAKRLLWEVERVKRRSKRAGLK